MTIAVILVIGALILIAWLMYLGYKLSAAETQANLEIARLNAPTLVEPPAPTYTVINNNPWEEEPQADNTSE